MIINRITFHEEEMEHCHLVYSENSLSEEQITALGEILRRFPSVTHSSWQWKFQTFDPQKFDKYLLSLAANAFEAYKNNSMLGIACSYGDTHGVKQLLQWGANPNALDGWGKLPLHWAIVNPHAMRHPASLKAGEIVDVLLQAGARIDIQGFENMTVYEYVMKSHCIAAKRLIKAYRLSESKENCPPDHRDTVSSALVSNSVFSSLNPTKILQESLRQNIQYAQ